MAKKWTSVNLEKKFVEQIEQDIENKPGYSSAKEYIKEAVRTHQQKQKREEDKKLIELLEKIIQQTELDKEEILKIIKEEK